MMSGVAIGLSLWALTIATRAHDLVSMTFGRGRFVHFTPPSSDNDEGTP
jgi:Co/Zn/Cd efflux system component